MESKKLPEPQQVRFTFIYMEMITDADICSQSLLSKFALTMCCELLFLFDLMTKENQLNKLERNISLNIADFTFPYVFFSFQILCKSPVFATEPICF